MTIRICIINLFNILGIELHVIAYRYLIKKVLNVFFFIVKFLHTYLFKTLILKLFLTVMC